MSNFVKAKMAFYTDSVGSKAQNEVFEVKDEKVLAELEQAGYVQKVDGEEAQAKMSQKNVQDQVGQRQALTNEAVSLANHVHNVQANAHTQNVQEQRQNMTAQQAKAFSQAQADAQNAQNRHVAPHQTEQNQAKAKKADK